MRALTKGIVIMVLGLILIAPGVAMAQDYPLYMQMIGKMVSFLEDKADSIGMPGFCWACPIFRVVFVGVNILVNAITGALSDVLIKLAAMILLFIIAFKILKAFLQVNGFSGADFLKDLFIACFKVIVVIVFLNSMNALWYYLLEPILNLALGFANHFQVSDYVPSVTNIEELNKSLDGYNMPKIEVNSCDTAKCTMTHAGAILGNGTCNNILKTICHFNSTIVAGMSLGILFMGSAIGLQDNTINPVFFLIGLGVVLSYGTVFIRVPLLYVEALFKMAFVLALSPILLVLWLIPATTSYTTNALKNFLGCCLQIVFLSFMGVFAVCVLNYSLGAGTESSFIKALLEGQELSEALKKLPAGILVAVWAWVSCALATRFFEMAASFADFFAQTQSPPSTFMGKIGGWIMKGTSLFRGIT